MFCQQANSWRNDSFDERRRRENNLGRDEFSAVPRPIITTRREEPGFDRAQISNASLIGGELFIFHDYREEAGPVRPPQSGAIAIAADPGGSFSRALVGRRQGDKEEKKR